MANRRCFQTVIRHCPSLLSSTASLRTLASSIPPIDTIALENPNSIPNQIISSYFNHLHCFQFNPLLLRFSSQRRVSDRNEDDEEEDYGDEDDGEEDDGEEDDGEEDEDEDEDEEEELESERAESNGIGNRTYSVEEKAEEASAIGYKVIGPLDPTERPFTPYEPVFAVIQIGSHQFKVSNGDVFYTERLKFCEVNDKLLLNKVLMLGSRSQTIIGRPILPEAAVYAVVEEHALDAKVIIFKKKRRKNYRRTKGHRQELTRLRITDIQGIEKPEKAAIAA